MKSASETRNDANANYRGTSDEDAESVLRRSKATKKDVEDSQVERILRRELIESERLDKDEIETVLRYIARNHQETRAKTRTRVLSLLTSVGRYGLGYWCCLSLVSWIIYSASRWVTVVKQTTQV